jgi:myo-inositol-1(or 4)-monophosphatase
MDAATLIVFAEELAASARAETLPRWRDCCRVEDKGEKIFDPVTEADREAERVMRQMIHDRFPDHAVSGEEWGDEPGTSRWSWSLDPVDGTRSFMCRLPTWTTLIALLDKSVPAAGLIDAPVLDETYIGDGNEAWLVGGGERAPLRASACASLADARLSTTDPFLFDNPRAFERLQRGARVTRYGHDAYGYARLAAGSIDLVVESGLKPHDYNALIPVIRGAGGHIGDWSGGSDFARGNVVAAATRQLYDEALELLARA